MIKFPIYKLCWIPLSWKYEKDDVKAKAVIGLLLNGEQFEEIRRTESVFDMGHKFWICFKGELLLNILTGQHRLYSAMMSGEECVLA